MTEEAEALVDPDLANGLSMDKGEVMEMQRGAGEVEAKEVRPQEESMEEDGVHTSGVYAELTSLGERWQRIMNQVLLWLNQPLALNPRGDFVRLVRYLSYLCALWTSLSSPMLLAFELQTSSSPSSLSSSSSSPPRWRSWVPPVIILSTIADVVLMFEMLVASITSFPYHLDCGAQKKMQRDVIICMKQYARTWLLLDAFSAFPAAFLLYSVVGVGGKLGRVLEALLLLKGVSFFRLYAKVHEWVTRVDTTMWLWVRLGAAALIALGMSWQWSACVWLSTAKGAGEEMEACNSTNRTGPAVLLVVEETTAVCQSRCSNRTTLMRLEGLEHKYFCSLLWSLRILTLSSSAESIPQSHGERMVEVFAIFFSVVFGLAYVLAKLFILHRSRKTLAHEFLLRTIHPMFHFLELRFREEGRKTGIADLAWLPPARSTRLLKRRMQLFYDNQVHHLHGSSDLLVLAPPWLPSRLRVAAFLELHAASLLSIDYLAQCVRCAAWNVDAREICQMGMDRPFSCSPSEGSQAQQLIEFIMLNARVVNNQPDDLMAFPHMTFTSLSILLRGRVHVADASMWHEERGERSICSWPRFNRQNLLYTDMEEEEEEEENVHARRRIKGEEVRGVPHGFGGRVEGGWEALAGAGASWGESLCQQVGNKSSRVQEVVAKFYMSDDKWSMEGVEEASVVPGTEVREEASATKDDGLREEELELDLLESSMEQSRERRRGAVPFKAGNLTYGDFHSSLVSCGCATAYTEKMKYLSTGGILDTQRFEVSTFQRAVSLLPEAQLSFSMFANTYTSSLVLSAGLLEEMAERFPVFVAVGMEWAMKRKKLKDRLKKLEDLRVKQELEERALRSLCRPGAGGILVPVHPEAPDRRKLVLEKFISLWEEACVGLEEIRRQNEVRGSDVSYRAPLTSLQRQIVASKRRQVEKLQEEEEEEHTEQQLLDVVPSDAPGRRLSTMSVRPLARHSTIFNFLKLPGEST
ncbi:hypothetical protein GUITHDRAFT_135676 [Guillardia theta CCMP2712]|uniref:Ion transport domain-containing protein n=1 Tax=Guillardia theta (strain CCMP2712) TaxID=905079 RepID=L1JP76_GUITC|nr:hypothetical protein GUITHDRAFT_135676 [Guillardia theta CCMP2712]EKX50000.1 hypothetical protein GUITHDRAFT_135676 [Guillardia theta CCMP2712]|eukprot:XP_005836980.1 hypothetical protein GUITHDRAFT_135676 [Guillardia theta CCMP2712]